MANIATIDGNIIDDSGVSLLNQPIYPYPQLSIAGQPAMWMSLRNVYPIEYFRLFFTYPIVGKTYPDPSLGLTKIYGTPETGSTINFAVQTSLVGNGGLSTLSNVEVLMSNYIGNGLFSSSFNFTLGSNISGFEMPDLVYLLTGNVNFSANTAKTISFPNLKYIAANFSQPTNVNTLNMPSLEVVHGTITVNGSIEVSLPELLYCNGFIDLTSTSTYSTLSFPKLKATSLNNATAIDLTGTKSSLTTIDLPSIEYMAQITMPTSATSLTNFSFGSNLKWYGYNNAGNFITTSNSLNQASVDNILIRLAALDGTGGTFSLDNRTITITGGSATPSAAGLAAKATLQARGCTVTTN